MTSPKSQRRFLYYLLAVVIICGYFLFVNKSEPDTLLHKSAISGRFVYTGNKKSEQNENRKKFKTILFWGSFYKNRSTLGDRCINNPEKEMEFCPRTCIYTTNISLLHKSDAVVVHGREGFQIANPPKNRPFKQRWVFLMLESPANSKVSVVLGPNSVWNQPHIFNWTMSYRLGSDIHIPYGYIKLRESSRPLLNRSTPTKFGAWAVSNCNESMSSNRNKLIEHLQTYLLPRGVKIDIYGHCGKLPCPGSHPNDDPCLAPELCYKYLQSKYKFYFSLENSRCPEYVTEKFFHALKYGMVPIVLGPSRQDYERIAPSPRAFIHVKDFDSVADLGDYLLFLHEHSSIYEKYLDWREKFEIDGTLYFRNAWCRLCQKLYEADEREEEAKSYDSIADWWFGVEGSRNMGLGEEHVEEKVCKKYL